MKFYIPTFICEFSETLTLFHNSNNISIVVMSHSNSFQIYLQMQKFNWSWDIVKNLFGFSVMSG